MQIGWMVCQFQLRTWYILIIRHRIQSTDGRRHGESLGCHPEKQVESIRLLSRICADILNSTTVKRFIYVSSAQALLGKSLEHIYTEVRYTRTYTKAIVKTKHGGAAG